jgi:hypothetical protein
MGKSVTRDSRQKILCKTEKTADPVQIASIFSTHNVTLLKMSFLITGLEGSSRNTFTLCRCRATGLERGSEQKQVVYRIERGIGRGLARERR